MAKYPIPAVIECKNCGSTKLLNSFARIVCCDSCNTVLPFEGFIYKPFDRHSSKHANCQAEMDCPNYRSTHMVLGPEGRLWVCHDCGYHISNKQHKSTTYWFCDKCDSHLNEFDKVLENVVLGY